VSAFSSFIYYAGGVACLTMLPTSLFWFLDLGKNGIFVSEQKYKTRISRLSSRNTLEIYYVTDRYLILVIDHCFIELVGL